MSTCATPSLAEALPAEIIRVGKLKEQFLELRAPDVWVEPAIFLLTRSIENAVRASSSGDVLAMLRAYEDLKGYE